MSKCSFKRVFITMSQQRHIARYSRTVRALHLTIHHLLLPLPFLSPKGEGGRRERSAHFPVFHWGALQQMVNDSRHWGKLIASCHWRRRLEWVVSQQGEQIEHLSRPRLAEHVSQGSLLAGCALSLWTERCLMEPECVLTVMSNARGCERRIR